MCSWCTQSKSCIWPAHSLTKFVYNSQTVLEKRSLLMLLLLLFLLLYTVYLWVYNRTMFTSSVKSFTTRCGREFVHTLTVWQGRIIRKQFCAAAEDSSKQRAGDIRVAPWPSLAIHTVDWQPLRAKCIVTKSPIRGSIFFKGKRRVGRPNSRKLIYMYIFVWINKH